MRDLYHRLNLQPGSSDDEIRRAVGEADAALRSDAERVLLNPRHRQSYDRAHRLLTTIGQLRTRLDLQLRPFWARSGNQDFTAPAHRGHVNPIGVMQSLGPRRPQTNRVLRFVVGIIVGAVAAWLFWHFKYALHL